MLLTGTFLRAVDQKLRLAIPKRLRDALIGEGKAELFVTPGNDGSLAIYNPASLESLPVIAANIFDWWQIASYGWSEAGKVHIS